MKLLAFVTDAYGGHGGVAQVNRDLFESWTTHPEIDEIVVVPRVGDAEVATVPPGVDHRAHAARSTSAFLRETAKIVSEGGYDGVFTGHLHLSPFASLAAKRAGVPWVLLLHGVEAWGDPYWPATQGPLATALTLKTSKTADLFVAVSDVTRQRYATRLGISAERGVVVPNSVDLSEFGAGPKRTDLLERYGLVDRTILLTLARISSAEQYKGFDEIIEALPALSVDIPNISYLICGTGDDRERLEAKAAALGVADRVVFAGYVPEEEKADHYRLGDAFVMPGWGEGFGIVYLESLACGVPVVASTADASIEAVRHGALGAVADPKDPQSVLEAVRDALGRPKGVPEGLEYFSRRRFAERWMKVAERAFNLSPAPPSP